jgi:hypothetical protein
LVSFWRLFSASLGPWERCNIPGRMVCIRMVLRLLVRRRILGTGIWRLSGFLPLFNHLHILVFMLLRV